MISAMIAGSVINGILMIGTLRYYFANISYKGLWNTSLSSAMAMEIDEEFLHIHSLLMRK